MRSFVFLCVSWWTDHLEATAHKSFHPRTPGRVGVPRTGRWKARARVSDVYDDIDLPFPDVKVAGKLCLGGPCKHVVKEGSGIMDAFLPEHIAPNIRTRFPDDVTIFLAKVLLWLACLLAWKRETAFPKR
jgi:hypothetical protein